MKMFRYFVKWYDDLGEDVRETRGYIGAKSYTKAMKRIEEAHTDSVGACYLIKVELYEVDTVAGMLDDRTIDKNKYKYM